MSRPVNTLIVSILFFLFVPCLLAQDAQVSSDEAFQRGLQLYEDGLFVESISLFDDVISSSANQAVIETAGLLKTRALVQTDPDSYTDHVEWFVRKFPNSRHNADLLIDLGHVFEEDGQYQAAISRYERALEFQMSQREQAELLYQMAEAAVEDNSFDQARSYYLTTATDYPGSEWAPKALYARGRLFIQEENFAASAEAFELLRDRFPFDPMTRRIGTALGESYFLQARYADAVEALNTAMPYLEGEDRSRAVYLIAESHNALNNLEDAARFYRYYINRGESEDLVQLAHYGLGWVFHKQEIYHWAAESFANAANGNDETARKALYYKAVNEKMSGRYDISLNTFRDFGQRFTEGSFVEHAYYEWSVLAFEVGRYAEAIEVLLPLARTLETLDEPGKILTFLGEAYFANGEYTRALQTFDIVAEMTDLDPALQYQARFQRGWVQYSNQAYLQAQPEFEQVYQNTPNSELGLEALFWSADSHYQLQNYGPASNHYSRFINQAPGHELIGAAKYALAWSYFMMGDFENAVTPFIDFLNNYEPPPIALFPYETDTELRIGDSYFALGRYNEALEYYNRAIGAEPGGDYAMFQVANSYYRMDRNFEAVTEFRRLLRIYPFSTLREQAQYNVAYIYLNTGNYDQAISEFTTVIERYPSTEWAARSQYNIGDAYYNAGNYDEAIAAYKVVLDRYPRSNYLIEAINGIQYAQISSGGDDTSTEVLEEFLSENPTSTTADRLRFRQAENLYRSGDYTGAVQEFRQYIRITNSQNLLPEAYYNLADSHLQVDQTSEAMESYTTIINEFPNSNHAALALAELGRLQYEQGNYQASRDYYNRLLQRGANYRHQANIGMGNASLGLGDNSRAQDEFESALSASPGSAAARVGLAKVHFQQEQYSDALEIFTDVANANTTVIGAEAQFMTGRTWHVQNQLDSALNAYSRVSVLFEGHDTWVAEAQYRIAEIYIVQGRRGDAMSTLTNITENYSGTEAAQKAARLLQGN